MTNETNDPSIDVVGIGNAIVDNINRRIVCFVCHHINLNNLKLGYSISKNSVKLFSVHELDPQ
jgi:hypothetical protein